MYEGIDEDLAAGYNPEKVAKNARTPKVPVIEVQYDADLLSVSKEKGDRAGVFYSAKFKITKSNNELVPEGAVYQVAFYKGNGSTVDTEKFWDRITPLLMAVYGETQVIKFPAVDKLGELLTLTKAAPNGLNLKFRVQQTTQPARPDKATGKIDPKYLNGDGTPKHFARERYMPASV
jgi:hypothetical protein